MYSVLLFAHFQNISTVQYSGKRLYTGVVKIKTMGCQRSVEAMLAVIYPFLKIYVQFQSLKLNSFYMRNCTVTYIETVQFRTPKLYSLGSVH